MTRQLLFWQGRSEISSIDKKMELETDVSYGLLEADSRGGRTSGDRATQNPSVRAPTSVGKPCAAVWRSLNVVLCLRSSHEDL